MQETKTENPTDGNAIIYCEGAYNTTNGKTAHGLVRFTRRYKVLSVIDSRYAGQDAGMVLHGENIGIPIFANLFDAIKHGKEQQVKPTHFVIGLAPDGGKLSPTAREDVKAAVLAGLNIDSGLHDILNTDEEILKLARQNSVQIRDVRKPKPIEKLHFYSGKIREVKALKIAVLGTDSAVGKRTTAWKTVTALQDAGYKAEMIGTGQTAWLQGAQYSIMLDSVVNDFVTGEIEHVVWQAWESEEPDVIVIEGQGGIMHPAYPGGYEILCAAQPDLIILQHAPNRKAYDGYPDHPIHPLEKQIEAIGVLSGKPIIAITINHEGIARDKIGAVCEKIESSSGIPVLDVLLHGPDQLTEIISAHLKKR